MRKRKRKSYNYLSMSQKKNLRSGNRLLWISGIITVLAVAVLLLFVIRNKTVEAENEESSSEIASLESETEDYKEAELRKKQKRKEVEEKALAIEPQMEFAHFSSEDTYVKTGDAVLDEANKKALGYDYESAISLLKNVKGYEENRTYTQAISKYQAKIKSLTEFKINNNITHIFFHSLIVNPDRALNKEIAGYKMEDYNKAMTTVSEFVSIMEEMYSKGYVLLDIYDLVEMEPDENGKQKMTYQSILLPEGKKPFILSIDDTNYYEYMTGHGFSTKLCLDEDGHVTNEYVLSNGETVYGSFDVITILEDFLETHPDFAYHGARGIAGITGYNGALGYRTSDYWYTDDCPYYENTEVNAKYKAEEISGNNLHIEEDKITATKVADGIKNLGWRFASHSWAHKRLDEIPLETLTWDCDMWKREVEPILGETDLMIFPFGNDIGQGVAWRPYDYYGVNDRYETLKSYGFRYFFNVDSSVYFMQRTDDYFRQGRRNLDGERMWQAVYAERNIEGFKNRLGDLLSDVGKTIDPLRPELK